VTIASGEDRALAEPESDTVRWGQAEFIAAEEMDRSRGFWWAPDGRSLLVERLDEAPVALWHLADPADPTAPSRPHRYPAAGTANADVSLWHVSLDGKRTEINWDRQTFEYLARESWTEHGPPLIQVLSRDQRRSQVLSVEPATGATEVLRELSDMGVRLSIDDFGTGYSSLERLRQLPVDEVKIDKSFIQGVGTSANDVAIVTATIELARSLGLRVVAEGVEAAEVWQTLVDLGADTAQGYFLSRPMDSAATHDWFEEAGMIRPHVDAAGTMTHGFEAAPGYGLA
jgi:dipeptidyl-peptidase-4